MSNTAIIMPLTSVRTSAQPRAAVPPQRDAVERFAALLAAPAHGDTERRDAQPRSIEADRPAATDVMNAETLDGLLDQMAELVWLHRPVRAERWAVTVWLRGALLRGTRLSMAGTPGRIDIRFATRDPHSLRCLHAGLDTLRARLREQVPALELRIAIEAAPPEADRARDADAA
jgi:Type III secretion protein (HpaP)